MATFDFMHEKMGQRLNERFTELNDLCWESLGNPTVADVERLKRGTTPV